MNEIKARKPFLVIKNKIQKLKLNEFQGEDKCKGANVSGSTAETLSLDPVPLATTNTTSTTNATTTSSNATTNITTSTNDTTAITAISAQEMVELFKPSNLFKLLENEEVTVEKIENKNEFGIKKKQIKIKFYDFMRGLKVGDGTNSSADGIIANGSDGSTGIQSNGSSGDYYLNTQYNHHHDDDDSILERILSPPLRKLKHEKKEIIKLFHHITKNNLTLQQMTLWVGGNKIPTTSGLHHDFHDNFYIVLEGRKQFTLYPPSDYPYLYLHGQVRHLYENGLFVYHGKEKATSPILPIRQDGSFFKDALEWKLGKLEDLMDLPTTSRNERKAAKKEFETLYRQWESLPDEEEEEEEGVDNVKSQNGKPSAFPPSFSKIPPSLLRSSQEEITNSSFPLLIKAHPTVITLNPGDILFLPCGWFHEVVSTSCQVDDDDGDQYEYHMALNYWFAPPDDLELGTDRGYLDEFWLETFGEELKEELGLDE